MLTPSPCQLCCRPLITRLSGLLRLSSLPPRPGSWCHLKEPNWLNASCQIQFKKEPSIDSHPMTKYIPQTPCSGEQAVVCIWTAPLPHVVLGVLALCTLCAISAAMNLMCSGLQTSCPVILYLTEKRAQKSKASKHQDIFSLFFSPLFLHSFLLSFFHSSGQNNRETKRKLWLINSYEDMKEHRWRKRSCLYNKH